MTLTREDAVELFRQPPHRWLDVGSGEAAYRTVGRGPDVLFVHGWPVSSATFRLLLPHLAEHVTCHLVDLPGTGQSRWGSDTELSIDNHIRSVRRVVDVLALDDVGVVGHDSGGLIARHALAGDARVRAWGLIDTEQPHGPSMRFRSFLAGRHVPGFGATLAWLSGRPRLRRNPAILGGAFVDRTLLDGEFDEFFLSPMRTSPEYLRATIQILKSFDYRYFHELGNLHAKIDQPVRMVWGARDPFFPLKWAEEMVGTFSQASLHVVRDASLFAHEERPSEVAEALLPTLRG